MLSDQAKLEYIQEWKESGLTKSEFTKQKHVAYTTFLGWLAQEKKLLSRVAKEQASSSEEVKSPDIELVQIGSIELSNIMDASKKSGIHLSVGRVKIDLDQDFSAETLKTILGVLNYAQ